MRNVIALLVLIASVSLNGQSPLTLTASGFAEPSYIEFTNYSADSLYKKSKEWVQYFYLDPEEVFKSDIPGKAIRIKGAIEESETSFWMYQLTLDFKDNKVRATFEQIEHNFMVIGRHMRQTPADFYKRNGQPRSRSMQSINIVTAMFQEVLIKYTNYLNGQLEAEW